MARTTSSTGRERGSSTVELVSLATAVGVLLAAAAHGVGSHGAPLGGAIAGRITAAVAAPATPSRVVVVHHTTHAVQVHGAQGSDPPTGSELRPRPLLPQLAAWTHEVGAHTQRGPLSLAGHVSACVLCVGVTGRVDSALGAGQQGHGANASGGEGLHAAGAVHTWAGLAALEASTDAQLTLGQLAGRSQLHATGTVGLDAAADGTLTLGRGSQELGVHGRAVAGAVGAVEHRGSLRLLGIGLQSTVGAEGWAGAGATGGVHVAHHTGGKFTFDYTVGAAWGLGGATHVEATLDLSRLLGHAQVARPRASGRRSS